MLGRCLPDLVAQLEQIGDEGCTGLDLVLDQFCLGFVVKLFDEERWG